MNEEIIQHYKRVLQRYSKEESIYWWEQNAWRRELGVYKISSLKKLALRAGDDTPSTSILEGLHYIDYGGESISRDPVHRIREVTGMGFIEAINLFLSWEGNSIVEEFIPRDTNRSQEKKKAYEKKYLRDAVLNKTRFAERYEKLASGLFRSCNKNEQLIAENFLLIGFLPKGEHQEDDRIFIPEMDENGIAFGSYRYNRDNKEKKGLLRSNSNRVLFGSHLLSKYGENVILAEGHTDVVVNIAKRMAAITTGSATKKIGENIHLLAGKHFHDFPDLDIPGMLGAFKRGLEIEEWNKKNPENKIRHTIYWWAEWFASSKIAEKLISGEVTRAEDFFSIKELIPIKKGHACFNVQLLSLVLEEYAKKRRLLLPDHLHIKNWKLLSRSCKTAGYDWIDFHTENKSSNNYQSFIQTFKF